MIPVGQIICVKYGSWPRAEYLLFSRLRDRHPIRLRVIYLGAKSGQDIFHVLSAVSVVCVDGGSDFTGWVENVFAAASYQLGVDRFASKSPSHSSREVEFVQDTFRMLSSVRLEAEDQTRYVSISAAAERLHQTICSKSKMT